MKKNIIAGIVLLFIVTILAVSISQTENAITGAVIGIHQENFTVDEKVTITIPDTEEIILDPNGTIIENVTEEPTLEANETIELPLEEPEDFFGSDAESVDNELTGDVIVEPIEEITINETEEEIKESIANGTINQSGNILLQGDLAIAAFSGNGTGAFDNPYNISNCTQLQEMENDLGANFSLINNINCSDTINWNSAQGFDPIGSSSPKFVGSLNGNGYNITKLYVSRTTTYNGLFGYLGSPANVSSLGLINASIKGGQYTGGLTGYMDTSTTINNINITGSVTGTSSYVGGVAARALVRSTIDNCYFAGNVTGGSYTGGLVGYLQGNVNNSGVDGRIITGADGGGFMGAVGGNVWNSYASTETVTSSTSYDEVGGFVGTVFSGANITNSYATGNVSGDQDIGGFVGEINSGGTGLISNCYTTSNVYGRTRDIGGFVGVYWAGTDINNSYARGNVTGTGSTSYVGGFVGEPVLTSPATTISNCYSTGNLSGMSTTSGGFAGYMTSAFSCENIFFDNQTSKKTDRGSGNCIGIGKNSSDMKNVSTFTNTSTAGLTTAWDFVGDPNNDAESLDIWDIDPVTNDGYPILSGIGIGATLGTPLVTLNVPADNYIDQNQNANITFNCSATDSVALENISLYLSDATNQNVVLNQTTVINGTSNSTTWSLQLINGTYTWKCEVQDPDGNSRVSGTRTLTIGDIYEPISTFVSPTLANASSIIVTDFEVNVTIEERNLKEVKFNLNGTNYTIYNDSLVLMYNLDNLSALNENHTYVFDVSGNNNNGTSVNEAGSISSGKYGGAFDFDGVNDRVTIPTTFGIGTTGFTISSWVNLDSASEGGAFVKIGGTSPNQGFAIGVGGTNYDDTGNDLILLYEGIRWIDTNDLIGTGWHHVAMTVDSSGYPSAFIDGNLTYSDTTGAGAAPQQDITYLGGYTGSGAENRHADVTIDEVRIWNISLSAEDIYEHYISNLKKINNTAWEFYINQSKNATDGLSRSTHTYYFYVKDDYGYENQTNITSVIVDASGPTFSVFANQTTEYGASFSYDIDATDPSGVSCFTVNDTQFQIDCDGILQNNTVLEIFEYFLNITVNDTNNFLTSEIFWINVTDTTSPTSSIVYPSNGTNTTNTALNVNFTNADLNLDSCWYSNDTMTSNITLPSCGANLTAITWSETNHTVVIYANDTYGNENDSTINFNIDLISPTFSTITNQSILQKNSLSYDINANDTFGISCFAVNDSQFKISCAGLLENNTNLSVDTYIVNVTTNDTVNNENYSLIQVDVTSTPSITLTLDNPTVTNMNATQNLTFEVQVTITCNSANCGEINVSLDPFPVGGEDSETNLKVGDELITQSAITLYDNESFTYDIQDGCDISDGQSDVFDGGLKLYVNNTEYTGLRTTTEDSGREAFCTGQTRSLLNISRKVYVPKTANWSRYLEVLHNPTAGTVCVDVNISSNMGSDGSDFMNTSDYNKSWEVADHWMMWDDTSATAGDDAAGFVYQQDGASETIDSLKPVTASGGVNKWGWNDICVPAGGTKVLMHFFTQHNTRAESEAEADDIYNKFNDDAHTSGMSTNEKNAVVNWAISSIKSGLVSMNTSATPFYTTTTNPYNVTLNQGESETITFTINSTGDVNTTHEFYVYANMTSDMSIHDQTNLWNVTIINDTIGAQAPSITINYPASNNYITNVTTLNYTVTTNQILNECWASTDSGLTNTSNVLAGINFTDLVSTTGSNTWTVYCDDNNSLIGAGTVTFVKQPVLSLAWVTPTKNINVTQNQSFSISATLSCANTDCNNVNVSLDPVADPTPRSCSDVWGASCVGSDPTTSDYSYDGCAAGSYYSNGFWVDEITVDATTLAIGDTLNITCDFDCYSSSSLNDIAIMYYNGTWNKIWRQDSACTDGNYSQTVVISGTTGEQKARCSIGYNLYPNDAADDVCFDTTYSDNDDVNFTVTTAGKGGLISTINGTTPFYTITENPYNISLFEGGSSTITWTVNATGDQNVSHEFFIYANWTSNQSVNTLTRIWNITISNSTTALGPSIAVSSPVANSFSADTGLDILYIATSATLDSCWYTSNDGETNNTLANCINITDKTWGEGETTVTVYANDTDNLESSASVTFTIDLTNPIITINSPTNNALTADSGLDVNFTITETNIDSCWYSNDTVASNTTLASCANVTSVTWIEGNHNVTLWVNDSINNVVNNSISFTIDTISPNLDIVAPSNSTNTTNNGLDITYFVSDANLDSCWYNNNSGSNTTLVGCTNITSVTWGEGSHTVIVYANDSMGNNNQTMVDFNVDSVNPIINIIFPENNIVTNDNNLDINYSAVDTNIDSCWYSNDTMTSNTTLDSCANITSVTWTIAQHNVTIWANDTYGNINQSNVSFSIDSTNPTITIIFPTNNSNVTNEELDITYSVSDDNLASCWYSNDTMTSNTTLTGCANITSITWSVGNHNVTIYVNDSTGNENNSQITFTILPDIDDDGIVDSTDPLWYNESNVTATGITKLNITVGGNRTNETYSGKQELKFYDANTLLINFSHNFSSTNLDLSNVTIIKDTNYLIVNLSGQLQGNKTLYIINNDFISLCVKDAEVSSISEVSSGCDQTNETDLTSCLTTNITVGYDNSTNTTNLIGCTYDGTTFTVSNLQYSAIKGTVATPSADSTTGTGGSGGGSSGGGGAGIIKKLLESVKEPECQSDADCDSDKTCYYNQCVKLFDVKVLDVDSPISDDGLLGFTYFIKGMANFSSDVIINFWVEKDDQTISSGQDVIYLGSFEDKTEQTQIYVPKDLLSGSYDFYVQVSFENYQALSHRTIFVEEKDGLVEVRVDEPSNFWKILMVVFGGLLGLLLIVILILLFYRKWNKPKSRVAFKRIPLKKDVFEELRAQSHPEEQYVNPQNVDYGQQESVPKTNIVNYYPEENFASEPEGNSSIEIAETDENNFVGENNETEESKESYQRRFIKGILGAVLKKKKKDDVEENEGENKNSGDSNSQPLP
jgi:hypothetical protein